MGSGRWDSSSWASYSTTKVVGKTVTEIYKSKGMKEELDPKNINIRESRDSVDNHNSNAIMIGLDVTGSMGMVLHEMIKNLGTLVTEIHSRKPVSDPHIMFMGIGDVAAGDSAPLQCTQFEADIRIAEQLQNIYLEQGGGGNNYESYALAWYFASMKTSIDCFEKRGKKGYLFTIGDECPTPGLSTRELEKVFGKSQYIKDLTKYELYDMVYKQYNVFHIIVEQGDYYRRESNRVDLEWKELLGQNVLHLSDHTKLSEVIVSAIQVCEGSNLNDVIKSWDGNTSVVVSKAINDIKVKDSNTSEIVIM